MEKWRIVILALLALVLVGVAVFTWGSIGSAVMLFCLGAEIVALLFQRFVARDRENDFWEDSYGG